MLALEAQWHVMAGEDFEHARGHETGRPFAVDREHDHRWLEAVRGIKPPMLVCFAWSCWAGQASPTPELGKVEPWPLSETVHETSVCPRGIDESRQQRSVLVPVVQENRLLESWPAHKDVVRCGGINR